MTRLSMTIAAAVIAIPAMAIAQTTAATAPADTRQAATSPAAPALAPSMAAKVEQHIRQLHDQLGITQAQQPQWDQFAQVMRDNAAQMEQALTARGDTVGTANAAANMQSYAELAQVHATNMQKLASAFQSLYSSFPDQQKQVADAVFRNSSRNPLTHKRS